jgi:hypothetical protein
MARHFLGVLGVIAAGILLAVSAAMNYRFGFSLGKTAMDGQIYGLASAAADCFKALVPFFLFAAIRNRMWSQAAAAAVVWTVVTGYSMTSALGHAALNRLDTTGQRAVEANAYKDMRAEAKRAQDQIAWIPQHRPVQTVQADISGIKDQRLWKSTNGCADITGKTSREFCQQFHRLSAELGSAQQAEKLGARVTELNAKLAAASGGTVMAEADPQASVLAKLTGLDIDSVQTALTIFVALLIEIGSAFGMYVAFAYWRLGDQVKKPVEETDTHIWQRSEEILPTVQAPQQAPIQAQIEAPKVWANDNKSSETKVNDNKTGSKPLVPDSDVQRFYRERIVGAPESSSLTSTELYEEYCAWCEENDKEAFAHPRVTREIGELGVKKDRIGKRTRYFGIALRSAAEKDNKLPDALPRAA